MQLGVNRDGNPNLHHPALQFGYGGDLADGRDGLVVTGVVHVDAEPAYTQFVHFIQSRVAHVVRVDNCHAAISTLEVLERVEKHVVARPIDAREDDGSVLDLAAFFEFGGIVDCGGLGCIGCMWSYKGSFPERVIGQQRTETRRTPVRTERESFRVNDVNVRVPVKGQVPHIHHTFYLAVVYQALSGTQKAVVDEVNRRPVSAMSLTILNNILRSGYRLKQRNMAIWKVYWQLRCLSMLCHHGQIHLYSYDRHAERMNPDIPALNLPCS